MTTLLEVRQDSLLSLSDGNTPPAALLRMGILPVATKWDLLALQGKMFNLTNATVGTPIAGSAQDAGGIVVTAPTIRVGVPTGYTFFLYRFNLAIQAMAGTLNEIAIVASETNTYTSGGTSVTPTNWRTDWPAGSSVGTNVCYAAGSAIVEGTLVRPRRLFAAVKAAALATAEDFGYLSNITFPDFRPVVGPAAILVWVSAATTASTMEFSLDWAEVATVSAVTAV